MTDSFVSKGFFSVATNTMMAQEYDKKLDTLLMLILDKIKMLEYQGCTCDIDKQDVYDVFCQVLQDMFVYYDAKNSSTVIISCFFCACLLSQTSVFHRRHSVSIDLFFWCHLV